MSQTLEKQVDDSMPTSPEDLMAKLEELGIAYTLHHHQAVFTVAESDKVDAQIDGTHCRNLFLRDKKKKNFLLVLQNATDVDIKKLPAIIKSYRLSFGSSERLWEYLGVRPGSVCPFAIMNDTNHQVKILLDKSMMETNIVNYHPLLNTMTIGLKPTDLLKFIETTGHEAHIVDLSDAKPDGAE
ncbi:MAG: prolyl-tRNA synthetase associated domain-containing protein [Alphaproteobacteria bacterium]|nr:prolyl-tRNA synthetase associated domain-containing protein [Alphaproteobacteria bacterium]NCQ89002.1 prolyl-tRNA synthetase associated domain-containing protein [Alphaproteobacteria bacterium]NCT07903.1 prolyl-tRNA synthetase associated domain-containing protein [Alphaproteobacteria bacterium]